MVIFKHKKTGKLYELVQNNIFVKEHNWSDDKRGELEWIKDRYVLYKALYDNPDGPYFVRTSGDFYKSFILVKNDKQVDNVNHPAHYEGTIECIDAMEQQFGNEYVQHFCLLNAFKYLWRCEKKHEAPIEDLKKAMWYLNKYLELYK